MKKALALLLAVTISLSLAACATTSTETKKNDFPTETITIMVPFNAGASNDMLVRVLAQAAQESTNTKIIVENKGGSGGVVGTTEFAATAKPNGYDVAFTVVGCFTTQQYLRDCQFSLDDFKGVIGLTDSPLLLEVANNSKWNTLEELLSEKELIIGIPGTGTLPHVILATLLDQAGVSVSMVPFSSDGEAMPALLNGTIDCYVNHPNVYNNNADNLRILACACDERLLDFPDVPTLKECGYDLSMSVYTGLLVPAETPQEVVDTLYEIFTKAKETDTWKNYLDNNFIDMFELDGVAFTQKLAADYPMFSEYLEQLGFERGSVS